MGIKNSYRSKEKELIEYSYEEMTGLKCRMHNIKLLESLRPGHIVKVYRSSLEKTVVVKLISRSSPSHKYESFNIVVLHPIKLSDRKYWMPEPEDKIELLDTDMARILYEEA